MLAIGAGVAAAGLTAWLAKERNVDPAVTIADFEEQAVTHGFFVGCGSFEVMVGIKL